MKIEKLRGRGEKTLKRGHKLILTGNKLPDYDIFAEMERNIYVGIAKDFQRIFTNTTRLYLTI